MTKGYSQWKADVTGYYKSGKVYRMLQNVVYTLYQWSSSKTSNLDFQTPASS